MVDKDGCCLAPPSYELPHELRNELSMYEDYLIEGDELFGLCCLRDRSVIAMG